MATITWLNKIDGSDPGDPQKNVNAADMNQIKTVVNTNDGNTTTVATNLATHAALTNNPHSLTKTQVGLSNVDNTTDAGKPVSTAQQTALDLKLTIPGAWTGYTPTFTGFSPAPTFTACRYSIVGKTLTLRFTQSSGTSTTTGFTMTLPSGIVASSTGNQFITGLYTVDATTNVRVGYLTTAAGSNILTINPSVSTTAWTASGTKLALFTVTIEID